MLRAIADTHAVIWYIRPDKRLSPAARATFDAAAAAGENIGVSAVTIIEMIYLAEKGRIDPAMLPELLQALDRPRVVLRIIPIYRGVAETLQQVDRAEVPETGDRIIAATALHFGVAVITRDKDIGASSVSTIW